MAVVFNSGDSLKKIIINQLQLFTCCVRSNPSNRVERCWLNSMYPLDVVPLVQDTLNNYSGLHHYTIFSGGGKYYSISVVRTNDIVKVYHGTRDTSGGTPSYTENSKIAQFNVSSIPSEYNVYYAYYNLSNEDYTKIIILKEAYAYNVSVATVGPVTGLFSDAIDSSLHPFTYLSPTETVIPRPYVLDNFAITPELYALAPSQAFGWNANFYIQVNSAAVSGIDCSGFSDASSEPPEPYPPTPPTPDDPNEDDPDYPSTPSTPDQDHTPIYDPVPIPDMPSDGVADAGFVTMYRMTFREFDDFASECFASNAWDAIKLLFSNPMDFLIGASLLPFIPDADISYKPKFGQFTFTNAYPRISEQFVDINCGDITIKKFWGSCFDYEPYTKIQIWLPYIGYRDLPTDEVMGTTINVKYRCDCLTGDCVAFISTGVVGETGPQIPRVLAQFYGNCAVRAPFGSESYDSAISAGIGMIGAAAGVGLGAVAGASGLIAGGGALTAGMVSQLGASSMNNVIGMKPNISRGGAAGASAGYMSIQKPYIIRRIPRQNLPEGYVGFKGYPANITSTLGDLGGGYAEVDNIQLNDIPAMETERKEIIEYLKGGVLL